jgi:ABC-type branched-subunit amino acid transport system substrate-binding protein/cytochrome c553
MRTKVKLCAVVACVLLALLAFASSPMRASAARAQGAKVEPARGLTPQERRGRAIYARGESSTGREITAFIGEVDVPASTVTCAGCHGARGEGKTEGGVTAGNLTWANLTKSYGHTHPTGRKHGPFDEAAFARALADGVDPAGNTMLSAMPRFKMSPEDVADLIAYVKRIEDDRDPGISDAAVRVGTILPSKGALAELGAAMRDVLTAFFDDVNGRGGIYNRRVELQSAESGSDAAQTAEGARRLVREGQVFALVGGFSAGADRELASLAQEDEVPFVGPSTLLPQTGFGANRYIFYLLPGMTEQARALVNFSSQRQTASKSSVALVYSESDIGKAAAAAAEAQCEKVGCGELKKVSYARGKFDAPSLVRTLKGAGTVFFFGSDGDETAFVREAEAASWKPDLFLLGALTGRGLAASVPEGFGGRVFLAFPTIPADVTPEGEAELRALAAKYKFTLRHPAAQLSALAAAKVLVEGLERGGKDLSREKLITALEGLYDYETGLTPRLTFGPNRRVGASGAYVVTIDAGRKEFVPTGGWVKAD